MHPYRLLAWFRVCRVDAKPASPLVPRWPVYVGLLLGIWLTFVLYSDSLSLPFIQEDSFHIRWLSGRSILDIWLSAEGAPAYRPLGKSLVKLYYVLLGHHDRAWLRFNNIGLHAVNVALTALIGVRLDAGRRRYWTGGMAALLFAVLPFSYQAIPWINNFFYPLSIFLLLLMTAVYWQARVRNSPSLLVLALLLCLLAPFEIEYGAVGSGLLLIVEIALWFQGRQERPWLLGPALGLLMNVAFVVRWLTVPKVSYSFGPPTAERIVQISTYYLQGFAFPISPLAGLLRQRTDINDLLAVAVVCLPAFLFAVAFLIRRNQRPLLAAGLLWYGLLALPSLVAVDFDYVINSPRLIYPPGPGAAWLWAGLAATLVGLHKPRLLGPAAGAALLLLATFFGVPFVRERIDYYHLVERPVQQLAEVAVEQPDMEPLLIVNFPSWVTPPSRTFALGNHGIQLIPDYVSLGDLVYAMTASEQIVRPAQFTLVRPAQPYYYGMLGDRLDYEGLRSALAGSGDVYLTHYAPAAVDLAWAGRVTDIDSSTPIAIFDGTLEMALTEQTHAVDQVGITMIWRIVRPIDQDWTVFVHLYDSSGALVSQADGYPLLGLSPFWMWPAGQQLLDQRTLRVPIDASAGLYAVGVGIYDRASGVRIPAASPAGDPLANDTILLPKVDLP